MAAGFPHGHGFALFHQVVEECQAAVERLSVTMGSIEITYYEKFEIDYPEFLRPIPRAIHIQRRPSRQRTAFRKIRNRSHNGSSKIKPP